MMNRLFAGGCVMALCMTFSARAEEVSRSLTLVKDGKPTSVIVVPAWPNEAARAGAAELQWHIKKITGAELPIVDDRQKTEAGQVRILIGESLATRALGITAEGYQRQEYSMATKDNAIILLGYDRVKGYPAVPPPTKAFRSKGRFSGAFDNWASVGVKDHGFNDEKGTMECFVYQAKDTNETSTGWMIFRVGDDKNGHNVDTRNDKTTKTRYLVYQTFVDGKVTEIAVKDAWRARTPGWHHLMVTWDAAANKSEVFLDGKSVGTATYTKTSCSGAPWFSIRGDPNNIPSSLGPIDEVRVSKVVRKPVVPEKPYETDEDTLVLLHFDEENDIARDDSEYPRISPNKVVARSDRVGSLYAVYDFLQNCCDVRWYAQGEEGMCYPETKTLTVTVAPLRRQPAIKSRTVYGGKGGWGLVTAAEDQAANGQWYDRMKLGGQNLIINHSFEGFPDMYWEKNPKNPDVFVEKRPEYFQLQKDGSRLPRQMCWSNTGLVAQVIADARRYFDTGKGPYYGVGGEDFYVVAPRDDNSAKSDPVGPRMCFCDACQKAIKLGGTYTTVFENGNASELVYGFLNKIQAAINQSHPGKHIACFNYVDYTVYPKTLKVDTNLYIGPALGIPLGETNMKIYKGWRDNMPAENFICWWGYLCFPWETGDNQKFNVFPDWNSHAIVRDTKMLADDKVRGILHCGMTPYIDAYIAIKALDDPTLDVDKELAEFFTRYYAAAAQPMKDLYYYMENIQTNDMTYSPEQRTGYSPEVAWYWQGRPEVMKKIGAFIEDAKKKADTDLAKKRVAAYERDIWGYMQKGYNDYVASMGGKYPRPWLPPLAKTTKWDPVPDKPFLGNGVFFRNGGPGIGNWVTGFDDRKGTMEAWVYFGKPSSNFCKGAGMLFEIQNFKPASGHRVYVKADVKKNVFVPVYETWVGSKTNRATGAPITKFDDWHHIAVTWQAAEQGGGMTLQVDAKPSGKASYRATECAKNCCLYVGWPKPYLDQAFGPIDEVRLSNTVRQQVLQKEGLKADPNTVLLMNFEGPEGSFVEDIKAPSAAGTE